MSKKFKIDGMSCKHCVKRVEEALQAIPQVSKVKVSLKDGIALVKLSEDVADAVFVSAITDAGYILAGGVV